MEHVLVVEDSDTFRKAILSQIKEHSDFVVTATTNYQETKELLSSDETNFFAVLSDLHLPDANDGEIIDLLLSHKLPTIVLTSDPSEKLREKFNREPLVDYLLKRNMGDIRNAIDLLKKLRENKSIKVLIVDDSRTFRRSMKSLLGLHKFCILEATDGIDGLNVLDEHGDISIILVDYIMPVMDGVKFTKEARKRLSREECAIIAISSDQKSTSQFLKSGANDFIYKPFSKEEFFSRLYNNLNQIQTTSSLIKAQKEASRDENLLSQYRNAMDCCAVVSKTDTKGIITYANDQFCKVSHYGRDELIGKSHNIVRHPEMPKEAFEEMWSTIKSKKTWNGLVKNRTKDGKSYWMNSFVFPLLDENGEIDEYISIRHDVTAFERYKEDLEQDLNVTTESFHEALRLAITYEKGINESNILSRTDLDGKITYVNDAFCRVSGFSKEELIGQNHNIIRHPDSTDEVFKEMWDTITAGNVWKKTIKNKAKNGSAYFVNTTIMPIKDENDEIVEYMAIRHDVTEIIELKNEIEESQREITYRIGEIAETRSKETGNHIKRVAKYSRLLAELLGLSKKDVELVYHASPLHDVGKVAIPDSVLKKAGKLTEDEWKTMKAHSEIGYQVFKDSRREMLQAAAIIAHEHHEKYNGKGYPKGLKGNEIHVFGRIIAVADVFDALGSDRCYKKAWELERILGLFREERGEHFDPKLVDLFFENLNSFLEIREMHKDV